MSKTTVKGNTKQNDKLLLEPLNQISDENEDINSHTNRNGIHSEKCGNVQKKPLDAKRVLLTTNIVVGVCQGCFFIYNSLLPYLSRNYGMDPVKFGYMQSGAALIQLAISPLLGRYGDKYGARAVLLLSAISTAFGHVTLGLASSASMLVFSRSTILTQDIRLGAQIMVTDLVHGPERGVAMGKLILPMSIGMLIGPALAGQLAKIFGAQETLLLTWVAPVMCVFVMMNKIPAVTRYDNPLTKNKESSAEKTSMLDLIKRTPVPILMLVKLLTAVPFMTLAQNLGVIGMTEFKLSPQMNGFMLSYNGIIGVFISAFVMGRLSKRYTEDQLLCVAPLLMSIAYLLLSQTYSVWTMLMVLIPWNLGNAILDNQIVSRLTRAAPAGKTGAMVGLNASLFQLARIVAPLLGGYFVQKLGFQSIGYFGMMFSLLLAVVVLFFVPRRQKRKNE